MKPLSEWTTDELRAELEPAYRETVPLAEVLNELLRRETERVTAAVHAKFRSDLALLVEATKQAQRERCAASLESRAATMTGLAEQVGPGPAASVYALVAHELAEEAKCIRGLQ